MTTAKTLNQIIAELEAWASSHLQVHSFGQGDIWEVSPSSSAFTFPLMWVTPSTAEPRQNELVEQFNVIVCDLVDNGEANELEVLSDTRQILKDLVSWYRQQHSAAYIVEFQGAITPFTERFAERVSGNALTIRLRQPDDYDECAIPLGTPIPAPPFCEPATYTLNDTSTPPNQLSSGSIPSGGSAVIVAPNATVLRDGQPFGSVPSGGSIDVPSDCPPCADGNIELNGTPVGVVASGGTADIPVIQDGSPVGSWNGTQWVIPSCPAPSQPRNTAMAIKTGQTVSYGTGSDGDVQAGRGVDFFTLEENNPFGNTNRFTDINGGQTFNVGDIALDWATYSEKTGELLWILLDRTGNRNWGDCLAEAVARTDHGYNDWRLLNVNEAANLMYWEVGQNNAYDYTPMSVTNIGSGTWTGTTYPRDATRAAILTLGSFSITGQQNKTTLQRGAICRTGNISELSIP